MLKSSLRNAEIQYYSHQLEMHKTDISRSWKILKKHYWETFQADHAF